MTICFNAQRVTPDEIYAVDKTLTAVHGDRGLAEKILGITQRRLKHIISQHLTKWKGTRRGRRKGYRPRRFKLNAWEKPIALEGCYSELATKFLRLPNGWTYQRVYPMEKAPSEFQPMN